MPTNVTAQVASGATPFERYAAVRGATVALTDGLSPEDCQVQSMPDASPVKWHLAHTSWFFETFLLLPSLAGYRPFRAGFDYLFNSYYYGIGDMAARPQRGMITRPSLDEVFEYRRWVDEHMGRLLEEPPADEVAALFELGLNHEQQHQELILTDIKHALSLNPLKPACRPAVSPAGPAPALEFRTCRGGIVEIGAGAEGFAFDNERPRHRVLLQDYQLANRPVTNGEFREFVRDGGYQETGLWLSDAWMLLCAEGWRRPLYWSNDLESAFTLAGEQALDPDAPACHLSFYEADAFARWAGARLPTEFEWEAAAPAGTGAVWEWTASAYLPYPGFRPLTGAIGEYNGKFMSGQMVLRGGHVRPTYRNFFPPAARWQFSGLRLARDA